MTALKTISMYLRAAKTEAEEAGESTDGMANSVSELREELLTLTKGKVDIMLDDKTFKSTYEIMKDLSKVWNDLADIDQANIIELIGGKRNANAITSLLANFEDAENALQTASTAAGSAYAENEKYLDSIAGKISILQSKFETFSNNLIDSGAVKFVVDLGSGLLTVLDFLNQIYVLLPLIGVSTAVILKALDAKKVGEVTSQIMLQKTSLLEEKVVTDSLAVSVSGLTVQQQKHLILQLQRKVAAGELNAAQYQQIVSTLGLSSAEKGLVAADGTLIAANKGVAASFKSLMASIPIWGWIALGISFVLELATVIENFVGNAETSAEKISRLNDEFDELISNAQSVSSEYRDLKKTTDEIIPRFAELANGVNEFGENISLTDDEYKEFLSLNNQIAEMFPELDMGLDSNGNHILALSYSVDSLTESLEALLEAERNAANEKIADNMGDALKNIKKADKEYDKEIQKLKSRKSDYEDVLFKINQMYSKQDQLKKTYDWETEYQLNSPVFNEQLQNAWGVQNSSANVRTWTKMVDKYTVDENSLEIDWYQVVNSDEFTNAMAGLDKKINAEKQKQQARWQKLNPIIGAWLQTTDDYGAVEEDVQQLLTKVFSNVDYSEIGITKEKKLKEYMTENFVKPITESQPEVQNAMVGLFDIKSAFDSGALTVGEYGIADYILGDLQDAGMSDTVLSALNKALNLDNFKEQLDDVKGSIKGTDEEVLAFVNDLTYNDFNLVYSVVQENGSMSIEELQEKIKQVRYAAADMVEPLNMGDFIEGLEETASAVDKVTSAMAKLQEGTALSKKELMDLISEYPKLLEQENLFADGSVEAQKNALDAILDLKEQEYDAKIDEKIAELKATREVLQNQLDLETEKANLINEIATMSVNGKIKQEIEFENKLAELNNLQRQNYVSLKDGELQVNEEALNDELAQGSDFANEATENIWQPYGDVIVSSHTQGYSGAMIATNNYTTSLWQRLKNFVSRLGNAIADAWNDMWSGDWKGISTYFSEAIGTGDTDISGGVVSINYGGNETTINGQAIDEWISDQKKASEYRISEIQKHDQKIFNAIENLEALKGLDLTTIYGTTGSSSSETNKDNTNKEIEEYIADVDKYTEATQKLQDAQRKHAQLERDLANEETAFGKVSIQKELNKAYKEEQDALHELNNLRDQTVKNAIPTLEALDFQIEYNADTNRLYIANLEHLNELQAESAGEYETVEEATNALRKETEELIDGIVDLNEENENSSQDWLDLAESISEGKDKIVEYLNDVVTEAEDFVSSIQEVYDTLKSAAEEYNDTGAISVNSLKAIAEYGVEYMNYLKDENGMLSINKENIEAVITARTKQLAVDTAFSYVEKLRVALSENNVKELNRLISATERASDATWELVYANLELLDLDNSQYTKALANINRLRSLADNAVNSIRLGADESNKNYDDMRDALDTILDLTMELIKYETNQKIDALEEEKKDYREIINLKKEALQTTKEEVDYNKEVAKKVAEIAKIQSKINMLSLDDSREAQAEKAALEEELSELQTGLADYQSDYSIDKQMDMLDKVADAYDEEKDEEIESLKESISSTEKIYQLAIDRIDNNWDNLYDDIIKWNYDAGSSVESEIVAAWERASKAVQEYGSFVEATNRLSESETGETGEENLNLGASGDYGNPKVIASQMRNNSLAWFTASSDKQKSLENQNKTLANQLSTLYGKNVSSVDGLWYLKGSTEPIYSIGKWEAVDYIVKAMKNNSAKWNGATKSERSDLEKANEKMAGYIAELSGQKVWKDSDGIWRIGNGNLYDLYGTYHTGGVIGNSTLKKDEVMAILKDGELVLDERREKSLYKLVDFAQLLSERLGTAIDTSGFDNIFNAFSVLPSSKDLMPAAHIGSSIEFSPKIEVNISHTGSMNDGDARRYGNIAAETALSNLKEAFTKKGISNIGSAALK